MERLRTADLTSDQSFKDNICFHLGYIDMALYQLIDTLSTEADQQESPMFDPGQESLADKYRHQR